MDREVTGLMDGVVDVDGGELALAVRPGERQDSPVVLLIHGITASSRSFLALERVLPGMRLLAPDLRGRGRSSALPGPYGLERHADDLRQVLDAAGADRVTVVGHSMGGFVATLLAAAEPERVASVVLVDGGLPLAAPPGVDVSDPRVLGPVFARLTRVFPSREAYQAFWREAPAFAAPGAFTDDVADYVDYDLVPVDGGFRPSANPEAVATDQAQQYGAAFHLDALRALRQPVRFLRAPLGLQADPPGLYAPDRARGFAELVPQIRVTEVPEVNHYTVLMTSPGVDTVAAAVLGAVAEIRTHLDDAPHARGNTARMT